MFAVIILCSIFLKKYEYLVNVCTVISLLSILIRWYLEINATINSVKITSKYMLQNGANKDKVKELNLYYKKELLKSLPLFISYLFIFKIIRLMIVFII